MAEAKAAKEIHVRRADGTLVKGTIASGEDAWQKMLKMAKLDKSTLIEDTDVLLVQHPENEAVFDVQYDTLQDGGTYKVELTTAAAASSAQVGGVKRKRDDEALPEPLGTTALAMPGLLAIEAGALLKVDSFAQHCAPNTAFNMPIYLRKHLLDVHQMAVTVLSTPMGKRLVSLVGCPGTGKSWCGWLVAYTLQNQKPPVETLHISVRNTDVTAITNMKHQKTYAVQPSKWSSTLLGQLVEESKCQVCIVDVSMEKSGAAQDVFIAARQLIERSPSAELRSVRFMGIMSGHGEEIITGKQANIVDITQKLVMWSWTEEELVALRRKMAAEKYEPLPPEDAYAVCGGSVRRLFSMEADRREIKAAVRQLGQESMKKLLRSEVPTSDEQEKQFTRLLAFRPRPGYDESTFEEGVSAATLLPRSQCVIKYIKQNEHANFEDVAHMYKKLLSINAGAAGSAFELLVHMFWQEKIRDHGVEKKVCLQLVLAKDEQDDVLKTFVVDCLTLQQNPGSIESWDEKEGAPPDGYYTPESPRYPVLDSILRFKVDGEQHWLGVQVSIGEKHGYAQHKHKLLDNVSEEGEAKRPLVLWDFPSGGKRCKWNPEPDGLHPHWELSHVRCEAFEDRLKQAGL